MLVVLWFIFVADTKIIFGYNFVAPSRRKGNQCKAMIKLDIDDEIIGEVNLYTHAPSQSQVEVAKVKANTKRKAEQQQIHRNKSLELNSEIYCKMLLRISHRHQRCEETVGSE